MFEGANLDIKRQAEIKQAIAMKQEQDTVNAIYSLAGNLFTVAFQERMHHKINTGSLSTQPVFSDEELAQMSIAAAKTFHEVATKDAKEFINARKKA